MCQILVSNNSEESKWNTSFGDFIIVKSIINKTHKKMLYQISEH